MSISILTPSELRFTIDPDSLGFSDTAELLKYPLPWIGQERAEASVRFGLGMDQPDYNLFVLGEVGSGRSSLLRRAMEAVAINRPVPPDLCYLHNFDSPERPIALRLLARQGRHLREHMALMTGSLLTEIPQLLSRQDFKVEADHLEKIHKAEEAQSYDELTNFAESRHFTIRREDGQVVFTLMDEKGGILTEDAVMTLPKERRVEIEQSEQELRTEITRYFDRARSSDRVMSEGLSALQQRVVRPLLERSLQEVRSEFQGQTEELTKLENYLDRVMNDLLSHLDLFKISAADEEDLEEKRDRVMSRYRINLVVDNSALSGAPVIVEDNPLFKTLFGSIEYRSENDMQVTDFARIRAGSLLNAHGGFLMMHLRDLLADPLVWEKLRRLLRSGRLQIEEPGTNLSSVAVASLVPESVDIRVKIILIGSRQQYYDLQEADSEFVRRFRVKVDFAESFTATDETRHDSSILVAHTCRDLGLPHFSAGAVARLLEDSHRQVDDQSRQSAIFARAEALVMESAALCQSRAGSRVELIDVESALSAHTLRHDYPEQRLQESIAEGEVLISLGGERVGQLNSLTQVDLGDYRFGVPVRVTARTFAGEDGLVNIAREVEMSGPIHDKGVFILENYLSALFAHVAPLAFNASIVFEQEYHGMEGDSASCSELYVLLSSLSEIPLKQGIAVTGAVNQHGEILPVGGVNEKIEGYFRICATAGLDGSQGVLIPKRNRRHLMLDRSVIDAVERGLFHIYAADHVSEGMQLLTGFPAGVIDESGSFPQDSLLGRVQQTLHHYRHACQESQHPKT
ncbi:MAG: ATP-binding protein [Nitrosomonadaceae bacterium]